MQWTLGRWLTGMVVAGSVAVAGCASHPSRVVVDPASIVDAPRYRTDRADCEADAAHHREPVRTTATAALGVVGGAGTAATFGLAVMATGGLAVLTVLPAVALTGAVVGGATGTAMGRTHQQTAHDELVASCLARRGYRVTDPPVAMPVPPAASPLPSPTDAAPAAVAPVTG